MANRSQYQVQSRIVQNGGRINSYSYRAKADDSFVKGAILAPGEGSYVESIASPIDDQISAPVRFVSLETFAGGAITGVAVQEINSDTVFEAQVRTGTATVADTFKRGELYQDPTSGNYAVDLSDDTNASLEVVDVEPVFDPASQHATGTYNLVRFRFLSDALDATPSAS